MTSSIPYAEVVLEPAPAPPWGHTLRFLAAYYSLAALSGAMGVVQAELVRTNLAMNAVLAFAMGWWAIVDARRRKHPIPMTSRDWFVLFALLLVPAYVIWSRGWRGVGWLALHALLGYGAAVVTLYAVWTIRYGPW
jgi:hypothetical protein